MYARLWWKEMRTFWPIWVALGILAAGVQRLWLWAGLPEARTGMLIAQGGWWSMLYAVAVGAAALAGERETNTQVLLDMLPVSRSMLWMGKVSFALATTLGLTLALAALGALGSTDRDPVRFSITALALIFGVLLLEGIAWSLLWSVVLNSALQAAALGLVTVALLDTLVYRNVTFWNIGVDVPLVALRLTLAGGALLLSWAIFTRIPRPERVVPAPIRRPGVRWHLSWLRNRRTLFGRLAWETVRESRTTWLLLAGAALGIPLVGWLEAGPIGPERAIIIGGLATLFAGVSVFAPPNRSRSNHFLIHHGVRPTAVWTTRLAVCGIVLSALVMTTALPLFVLELHHAPRTDLALGLVCLIVTMFVVGAFSGQVFKQSITAWVVACLAFGLLVLPQIGLAVAGMIPAASLALFPALMLAISWAWNADWMNALRGPVRWLRLGAMVGGSAVLLVSLYIGYRAWGVPDIGSPFALEFTSTQTRVAPIPPAQNAAENYERILNELLERHSIDSTSAQDVYQNWDPKNEPIVEWWQARRGRVAPLRRASAMRDAQFADVDLSDSAIQRRIAGWQSLSLLLGLDSSERRSRGDLAGAWDDLRAAFRFSAHLGRSAGYSETSSATALRMQALSWALAWLADPRQTPAQLRSALADFRALEFPTVVESLHAEYSHIERTLLRSDGDAYRLMPSRFSPSEMAPAWERTLLSVMLTPSWERTRALRVLRLYYADQLQLAPLDPWERSVRWPVEEGGLVDLHWTRVKTNVSVPLSDLFAYARTTPLIENFWSWRSLRLLDAHDRVTLLSRAFEQAVALRIWQLEHGGRYPETLETVVPDLLTQLPPDPFSGKPFGYRRSDGQTLLPLGLSGLIWTSPDTPGRIVRPTRPGQWLLYSVGPDGVDDGARVDCQNTLRACDLIFALPPP